MRFTFSPAVVDLEPGQTRQVRLQLDAWRPPPGEESTRQFTVVASDGERTVEASGSLVQASSRAAIELLSMQLDPSVLHLSSGRRGQVTAVLDNRRGTQPVRVSMRGDDPQNIVRFTFNPGDARDPAGLGDHHPGKRGGAAGRRRSGADPALRRAGQRRPNRGQGRRHLGPVGTGATIDATRVPGPPHAARWTRGDPGCAAALPGRRGPDRRPTSTSTRSPRSSTGSVILAGFEVLITVGLVLIALGVLMMFGLTGPKGRLTRLAALLAAVVVAGLLIAFALVNQERGRSARGRCWCSPAASSATSGGCSCGAELCLSYCPARARSAPGDSVFLSQSQTRCPARARSAPDDSVFLSQSQTRCPARARSAPDDSVFLSQSQTKSASAPLLVQTEPALR